MRHIYLSKIEEEQAFALKAAKWFAEHPKHWTYSDGELASGCFLALRWGGGDDCVVVVKLDENHTPINYMELVKTHGTDEETKPD